MCSYKICQSHVASETSNHCKNASFASWAYFNRRIGHLQDAVEIMSEFIDAVGDVIKGEAGKVEPLQSYILKFDDSLGK